MTSDFGVSGFPTGDKPGGERPDGANWFKRWYDAYHQALFRADITGRRYRVWYEPESRWWNITELTIRHRPDPWIRDPRRVRS